MRKSKRPEAQELSVKDLMARWHPASIKTVRRRIARLKNLGLRVCRVVGARPRFSLNDVIAAEAKELALVNDALAGDKILTARQARALVGAPKRKAA